MINLFNGDCLEVMDKLITDGITVDAIITDPPYGTTACKWDSVIPFPEMWLRLNKLIKPNGAIVLFGSEPFSSALRMSNIKNYKYDWAWDKKKGSNYATAKKMPLKNHEIVSVFQDAINYIPQMRKGKMRNKKSYSKGGGVYGSLKSNNTDNYNDEYYPTTILEFSNASQKGKAHPTQKPVLLMEYLIKTYTNENELVLDFTMGSGTTGVACKNLNRKFIGIELDKNYFNIAEKRINDIR
jgi:site-specific DNA-methyltransferase (adenine-specific)